MTSTRVPKMPSFTLPVRLVPDQRRGPAKKVRATGSVLLAWVAASSY